VRFFGLVTLFRTIVSQPLGYAKSSTLAVSLFALRRMSIFASGLRLLFGMWLLGQERRFSFRIDFAYFSVGGAEMIDSTDINLAG